MEDNSLFYEYYDTIFAAKDYACEIDSALRLGLPEGDGPWRILELGSGTGNHTFALAGRGHQVVAVDVDARMVALARRKLCALGPELGSRVSLRHGTVAELEPGQFDLALALFNVVNYLHELDELATFLREIAARLKPGASLIFDCWNGAAALIDPPAGKTLELEAQGHRLRLELTAESDPLALRARMHYRLEVRDSHTGMARTGSYLLEHTLWPAPVIAALARQAGFGTVSLLAREELSRAATIRDWKVLFHCRKT